VRLRDVVDFCPNCELLLWLLQQALSNKGHALGYEMSPRHGELRIIDIRCRGMGCLVFQEVLSLGCLK
jgi:hypothetical protein